MGHRHPCEKNIRPCRASNRRRQPLNHLLMSESIPHTKPEVFILESLYLDNEKSEKDGELLSRTLAMYGKKPIYYYFRTERELEELIELFKISKYRYLHISCHGSGTEIHTTFDKMTYLRFGQIVSGALNNKRLFVSACEVGNDLFATAVSGSNAGLYSIIAPSTVIHFNRSAAFWSAFYFLMFDIDSKKMKRKMLVERLEKIVQLFDVHLHYTWNSAHEKRFVSKVFEPKPIIAAKASHQSVSR